MFEKIKQFFRKGAAKMNITKSLNKITDHDKINVNWDEYKRIDEDLKYYAGRFPNVQYKNSYGEVLTRPFYSLNMSKVAAHRLATLIFNEKCRINISDDHAAAFVNDVLKNNKFMRNFSDYLESMIALGGLAVRPYYAPEEGKIKLSWVQAPNFFPLQSNTNDVSECAIAIPSQVTEGGKTTYYTLLEFHEWSGGVYTITNELYSSDNKAFIGHRVPLNELYADLEETVQITDLNNPLFVYMKSNGMNNIDITSPLGLGLTSNSRNTLEQINKTYDMLHHEIEMSKRRIAVSDAMLNVMPDETGARPTRVFNKNEAVYEAIPSYNDDTFVQDLTSPLRATDYTEALNTLIKTLEMETSLSQGTFSFDAVAGLKTATEVASENSMTYQTRNNYTTVVEHGIQELIIAILELASRTDTGSGVLYSGVIPSKEEITIDFDDGVFTDKNAELEFLTKAKAAGFIPTKFAIMRLFDVDEVMAEEYLNMINGEVMNSVTSEFVAAPIEEQTQDE